MKEDNRTQPGPARSPQDARRKYTGTADGFVVHEEIVDRARGELLIDPPPLTPDERHNANPEINRKNTSVSSVIVLSAGVSTGRDMRDPVSREFGYIRMRDGGAVDGVDDVDRWLLPLFLRVACGTTNKIFLSHHISASQQTPHLRISLLIYPRRHQGAPFQVHEV